MEAWFRTFPSHGRGYATRPRQAGPNIVLTAYYSVADPDLRGSELFWEAGSGSSSKFRNCGGSKWSHGGPWTLVVEAQKEPWRVGRPLMADWHPFDDEQDPNLDPHQSKNGIRIHIKVTDTDLSLPNILH